MKNERNTIQDKESSRSYDIDYVGFLGKLNIDNGDFDDNVIDYIYESI